jgi:hypothetical protein
MSSLLFSRLLFINDLFALLPRSDLLKYIAPLFGLESKEDTAQAEAAQEVSLGVPL